MTGFLFLPRELRDQIYAECLVSTDRVIDISNLRINKGMRPQRQSLDLVPALLRSSRQLAEESQSILYGCNVFFCDVVAPWSCPHIWRRLNGGLVDCSVCLRISPQTHDEAPASQSWSVNTQLVRRLQLSIRPYTFLQWQLKHRMACPSMRSGSEHSISTALPSSMMLDILLIRMSKRSLMSKQESSVIENWHLVTFRYESSDVGVWRKDARKDLARQIKSLLAFARHSAKVTVLSGPNFTPYVFSSLDRPVPRWMSTLLHTGQVLDERKEPQVDLSLLGYGTAERIKGIAQRSQDSILCIDGPALARICFRGGKGHNGDADD